MYNERRVLLVRWQQEPVLRLGHASVHIPPILVNAGGLHWPHDIVSDAHHAHLRHVLDARSPRRLRLVRRSDLSPVLAEKSR